MDKIKYKGSKWYKCDLHLHSFDSNCFIDKEITPEIWIDRCIEKGLECVAVTDHNTGTAVDSIIKAAQEKNIAVFPGVEITCDTSKIHLLILFDVDKRSCDVRDFLVKAELKSSDIGKNDASTITSIFKIIELADKVGAIVIPAHIDEYNGLGSMSSASLEKLYSLESINAVQVVHKKIFEQSISKNTSEDLQSYINEYYKPQKTIDQSEINSWCKAVRLANTSGVSLLTFSDNPALEQRSKHGLHGIGDRFTFIKMGEIPTLEGLRQAFLLPEYRISNDFNKQFKPNILPDLWFKSIIIDNTTITGEKRSLYIDLNPQLNTIIGGRGSGKSSILRFIRGVFNRTVDIEYLEDILQDHNSFYQKVDKNNEGVLLENSKIIIEFVRNETLSRITAKNIENSELQDIVIELQNENFEWEQIDDEGYIDFFEFEHYSQKQIYEIAQEPNALRERIDQAKDEIISLKEKREQEKFNFFEISTKLRTIEQMILNKSKIETNINDLSKNIERMKKSGITELLKDKQKYSYEKEKVKQFKDQIEEKVNELSTYSGNFDIAGLSFESFHENHIDELKSASEKVLVVINDSKNKINGIIQQINASIEVFRNDINSSLWGNELKENIVSFDEKKKELEESGIKDFTIFEQLLSERKRLEEENLIIKNEIKNKDELLKKKKSIQGKYFNICEQISDLRKNFVNKTLENGKVKIDVKKFRNKIDFENQLRRIIQRENGTYQSDINLILDICFNGNICKTIHIFRDLVSKIRNSESHDHAITGHFYNLIQSLNDEQIDELELLVPEDEIEVHYRNSDTSPFKALSTASAGQKTTAILTFILSFGDVPLILDQPEDDLDNKLVYELIVDRLLKAKESRQIIVVTHNANVPVNGDAEYIISMDTDSKYIQLFQAGSVDIESMKREICEVMEGGKDAFIMRSQRYKTLLK